MKYKIFPIRFLLLTLILTWIPWIIIILTNLNTDMFAGTVLFAIGGIAPTLVALYLLKKYGDKETRKDYWKRVVDFKRIKAKWYFVIFLTVPIIMLLSIFISTFFGRDLIGQLLSPEYLGNALKLIPFIGFILIFGPLPEELGWRGYALDGLKIKYNGLVASLILGVVHAIWHIPLFFIQGYPLEEMAAQPVMVVAYFAMLIPKAVIFTWLFYRTNRSTLSAILFHFMINYTGMISNMDIITEYLQMIVYYVFATIIIVAEEDLFIGKKKRVNES